MTLIVFLLISSTAKKNFFVTEAKDHPGGEAGVGCLLYWGAEQELGGGICPQGDPHTNNCSSWRVIQKWQSH